MTIDDGNVETTMKTDKKVKKSSQGDKAKKTRESSKETSQ